MKMMPMRTLRYRMVVQACLLFSLLLCAGCGNGIGSGGGITIVGLSPTLTTVYVPGQTITLDAGQSINMTAAVVNDPTGAGATFALTGAGSLSTLSETTLGSSEQYSLAYTAPSSATAGATATVTVTSKATSSSTASLTFTLNPALVISTTTLPSGVVGTPYSSSVAASGGTGKLAWAVATGTIPPGIAISSTTGALSGTPATAGTYTFSVSVTDSSTNPNVVTQSYTVVINPTPPTVTTTSLPNGVSGTAYTAGGATTGVQLTYTGGNGGIPTWAVSAGSLPGGLTLSTSGLISGTPTNAAAGATYTFSVTVAVGTQTSAAKQLSITIPALPTVTTTSLPSGNIGIAYSQQLTYTGGAGGTVSWAITSGSLPTNSGLTFSSSGLLSGTPTTATTYNFNVAVTVGTQTSTPVAYTLVINSLIIISSSSATGEVGLPFSFHLTASGGTGPYTWSLTSGSNALPAGLTLNPNTGIISGSPSTNTGSPFSGVVVQAKDSLSATATQSMTFTINPARSSANNTMLTGQYAFLLSGFDSSGHPLVAAGKFTADGNGNILSGVMDINGTGLGAPSLNVALLPSTYSVGPDARGKLNITTASGTYTFVIALNTLTAGIAGSGYVTEFDTTGQNLAGVLAQQNTAAFTTASITGGFAFGLDGFAANSAAGSLPRRTIAGETQFNGTGGATSAELLASTATSATPIVPTVAISVTANGRGAISYMLPNGGGTIGLVIYVVSSGKYFMLSSSTASGSGAADLYTGQSLQQTITNGNFNAASLSGGAVVHMERLLPNALGTIVSDIQVGLFNFNVGKLTLNSDENIGGIITSDSPSGTYTVSPNGRVSVSLGSGIGGCTDCISPLSYFYLVGQNQGFMMDFNTGANFGYFENQTATGITAATFSGAYAAGTLNPLAQSATDSTASLTSNGAGAVTGTSDQNAAGTLTPDAALSATYTVSSTGRGAIPTTGSGVVFYIISATKAILLDLTSSSPAFQEVLHQ